jgi:hypothetical protein
MFNRLSGATRAVPDQSVTPAAIMVLMAIKFLCKGVAVFLRNRYDKRW